MLVATFWSLVSTVSTYIGRCMPTMSHGVAVRLTAASSPTSHLGWRGAARRARPAGQEEVGSMIAAGHRPRAAAPAPAETELRAPRSGAIGRSERRDKLRDPRARHTLGPGRVSRAHATHLYCRDPVLMYCSELSCIMRMGPTVTANQSLVAPDGCGMCSRWRYGTCARVRGRRVHGV